MFTANHYVLQESYKVLLSTPSDRSVKSIWLEVNELESPQREFSRVKSL